MGGTIPTSGNARPPWVGIEIKRRATVDSVEQLSRYLTWLNADPYLPGGCRGILVAQTVAPQARTLAESRGIKVVVVDYNELRGLKPEDLRLF